MLPRGYDSSIKREQYFPTWLRDEFRKHLDMQPLLFAPGKLSVVMHLRRSDLQRDDSRATPDSYYYKLAKEAWMANMQSRLLWLLGVFGYISIMPSATKSHSNWAKCSKVRQCHMTFQHILGSFIEKIMEFHRQWPKFRFVNDEMNHPESRMPWPLPQHHTLHRTSKRWFRQNLWTFMCGVRPKTSLPTTMIIGPPKIMMAIGNEIWPCIWTRRLMTMKICWRHGYIWLELISLSCHRAPFPWCLRNLCDEESSSQMKGLTWKVF